MQNLLQDVRYGARLLLRNPMFTAVVVVSLALGISANAAIFSLFNAIFLGTLPVQDPARLIALFTTDAKNSGQFLDYMQLSYPNFEDFRNQNQVFSGLVAHVLVPMSLSTGDEPERVLGEAVSGNYFKELGVKPAVGRTFRAEEDSVEGKFPVVVLSHHLWKRRFGGDESLVGKDIVLNRMNFTVIGVAAEGFRGTYAIGGPDLFVPMAMHEQILADFALQQFHNRRGLLFFVFGRLKPDVPLTQARAAMQTIARKLELAYPKENEARSIALLPLTQSLLNPNIRGQALLGAGMMMCVVALVLLIACANVANLLLARAGVRQREIAVRLSLGAGRIRLVRQLLTESFLMAFVAGLLGLLLAVWGRDLLWLMRPPFLAENTVPIPLDNRVLLFTAALTILTGILFGLAPALRATRLDLIWALKERSGQPSRSQHWFSLRNMLVVIQVALSLIALVGAGLFLRSMQHAQQINPGFEKKNLMMISVDLAAQRYDEAHGLEYYRRAIEAVLAMPQVKAASFASAPLFGGDVLRTVFAEGQDPTNKGNGRLTPLLRVGTGYFETIRMPILRGRAFTERDRAGTPMVAVVNETMARRLWPGEEAIGRRFRCFGETWVIEVVGIARDAKYATLGEEAQSFMYFPLLQHYTPGGTLHVRTEGDPSTVMGAVRERVQALDESMPLMDVTTVSQIMDMVLWAPRMAAALLALFGFLALLLAAIGIHGVISYSVAQRTQEIGIRMALGAQPKDVLKLIMGQTGLILLVGGAVGLAGAFVFSKVLATLLFDIGSGDPVSFAGTTLILICAALLASYLPARRATHVDPVVTLKYE
jgi:macrolide transport system ATP-binding/permease protein